MTMFYVDSVYTDTREVASNAVDAGTAYENIVKAIQNARTAADMAMQAADEAAIDVSTFRLQTKLLLTCIDKKRTHESLLK